MGMTRTRKAIIAFWVFIIAMLIWQFYSYNQGLSEAAQAHPQQEHYFFMHTNAPAAAMPVSQNASLRQTAFTYQKDTPSGNFTCSVTVKNIGLSKATDVQVRVRPFRGSLDGDEDNDQGAKPFDENSQISQIGQWVSFPDIAPGESATEEAIFLTKIGIIPGKNPDPQITFLSEKPAQPNAKPTPPPQY
jgi:hypothetical protein